MVGGVFILWTRDVVGNPAVDAVLALKGRPKSGALFFLKLVIDQVLLRAS